MPLGKVTREGKEISLFLSKTPGLGGGRRKTMRWKRSRHEEGSPNGRKRASFSSLFCPREKKKGEKEDVPIHDAR